MSSRDNYIKEKRHRHQEVAELPRKVSEDPLEHMKKKVSQNATNVTDDGIRLKDFYRKEIEGEDFEMLEDSQSSADEETKFLATLSRKEKKKLLKKLEKKERRRKRKEKHKRKRARSSSSSSSDDDERRKKRSRIER